MIKLVVCLTLLISFSTYAKTEKNELPKLRYCDSTKEFIVTLKFLRDKKDFTLTEKQNRMVAEEVSKGCTGASERFIRVTNLLVRAGLDSATSVKTAKRFAMETEVETETFLKVFTYTFFKKHLDLNIMSSMNTALELSLEFEGNREKVMDDYTNLVKFCVSESELDLPKSTCARLAKTVTKNGEKFKEEVTPIFIKTFKFVTDEVKGKRSTAEALQLAELVSSYGPTAFENFSYAYTYAQKEKGLGFGVAEALEFAKRMVKRSFESEKN